MRSVRVFFCFSRLQRFAKHGGQVIFALVILLFLFTSPAFAQATNTYPNTTSTTNSFTTPNVDPNVPQNQHTFAQAVTIEVLSAVMCQLTGIDPIDSSSSCLGINTQTHRIGYAPTNPQSSTPQLGGLLGITTGLIATTYTPPASTGVYTQYLADNFGITKKAYAAGNPCEDPAVAKSGYGFCGLNPIFDLWVSVRNIAYALLVLAFLFIGVGVMLRVKIDPRTVMTIQNQIPKVIMCIILITFSYAIAAFMIDLMWVSTYAGVNLITTSSEAAKNIDAGETPVYLSLQKKATRQLLEIPLVYVNGVFHKEKCSSGDITCSGVVHITSSVSSTFGKLLKDTVKNILGVDKGEKCFEVNSWGPIPTGASVNPGACIADFFAWIASIVAMIIIFAILIVALFKIWFNLVKSYIYSLFYIIVAPLMIVLGLLPSKPLGFEKWLRGFFANIAVFPITAFIIVGARVLMDAYNNGSTDQSSQFIPPLIGHNAGSNFGSILAFGAILIAPTIQTILREKLGAKGVGTPGIIAAGVAGGAAVVGAPVGRAMTHLNRRDSQGKAVGALAVGKQEAGNKVLQLGSRIPIIGKSAERRLKKRELLQGDRPYHKSEADLLRDFNKDNPGIFRRTWSKAARRKKRDDGSGPATPTGKDTPPTKPPTGGGTAAAHSAHEENTHKASTPPTGGAGTSTAKDKSGGAKEEHVGGNGPATITGPVTATGQVIIAHGGDKEGARQNLVKEMYDRHQDASTSKSSKASDEQKANILRDLQREVGGKSESEVQAMTINNWTENITNLEDRHIPKEPES